MQAELFTALERALHDERPAIVVTVIASSDAAKLGRQQILDGDGRAVAGSLADGDLERAAAAAAGELLEQLASDRRTLVLGSASHELFFDLQAPPPRLVVVGAVHVAIHLVAFARRLGYRTTVIDPRTAFATPERFVAADELLVDWPAEALRDVPLTESTAFAVLSHDLKIDLPALEIALASPARYIGALGSKKTHAKRLRALAERGFDEGQLARIHSPIGLDLGGRRAEEIALAVIAEIVAVRHGRRP